MENGSKVKEIEQRGWLIERKRCCGICPNMLGLGNATSVLEAEVFCQHAGETVCPKLKCDALAAMHAIDMRGISPKILQAAMQVGIPIPANALAA